MSVYTIMPFVRMVLKRSLPDFRFLNPCLLGFVSIHLIRCGTSPDFQDDEAIFIRTITNIDASNDVEVPSYECQYYSKHPSS